MKQNKICCFTGHRPQKLPFGANESDPRCIHLKNRLRHEIERQITKNSVAHFISGMAIGTDMYAAELVLELKKQYPQITLEAAIPCRSQACKWSEPLRIRYRGILSLCDKKTLLQDAYTADCMQNRNRYMVDCSDIIIAVWDGKPSGTGKTVRYAEECGKNIIILNPREE